MPGQLLQVVAGLFFGGLSQAMVCLWNNVSQAFESTILVHTDGLFWPYSWLLSISFAICLSSSQKLMLLNGQAVTATW